MTNEAISEGVRQFIYHQIESVEQLEILLLLYSEPDRPWNVGSLTDRLYANQDSVLRRLQKMQGSLIKASGPDHDRVYAFAFGDAARDAVLAQLVNAWKERRARIIELIFTKQDAQIRSFADAFKIKKKKDDPRA